ncbi:MAG: TraB/GumN family protein [Sphingomonas sp.]
MRKLLAAAAMLLAAPTFAHQEAPGAATPAPEQIDADPAIWVVRDADTAIYLFGTYHLLDSRPGSTRRSAPPSTRRDELVLEAALPEDPASLQPLILRLGIDRERRLSDRLTPAQGEALAKAAASMGIPAAGIDRFKPWFAAMVLNNVVAKKLGIDADRGPETVLSHAARARAMPIGELEGLEWQFALFDAMPEAQQLAMLRQGLDNVDRLGEMLAPMLAAWSSGDVEGLKRIMDAAGEQDPELSRLLFADRNAKWAGWIEERLKRPGIVFLAVGAGHLAGRESVQRALAGRATRGGAR